MVNVDQPPVKGGKAWLNQRMKLAQSYADAVGQLERRERAIVQATWFYLIHELYVPYDRKAMHDYFRNKEFRKEALETLKERLADPKDFGQAFKNAPTEREIKIALKWLEAFTGSE